MESPTFGRPKRSHRKQFFLFGIAVILPALVLLFFTLRINRQDRELQIQRAAEARQQKSEVIGRYLADRLDSMEQALRKEILADPSIIEKSALLPPELVFTGRIIQQELQMPWEIVYKQNHSEGVNQTEELMQRAQEAEFSLNDLPRALSLYNQALSKASSSSQENLVMLQLGRILTKSGDKEGARRCYENLLEQPGSQTDEYNIPYSLYAAERLSLDSGELERVLARIEELIEEIRWFAPSALYLIRDIATELGKETTSSPVPVNIKRLEQLAENRLRDMNKIVPLKAHVSSLLSPMNPSPMDSELLTWEAYGDTPWIIGIRNEQKDGSGYLFAFHGPNVLNSIIERNGLAETFPGVCRMAAGTGTEGILLGPPFQGIRLSFEEAEVSDWARSTLPIPFLYWLILFLVVGATAFGMYLLWRDVNRDLALAEMRSQFVSSVSHELKTPLTAIRMFAEALTIGMQKKPEVQEDYLQTIISESERLSRLLNNVLDFSKIEQGIRIYRFELTALEDVIQTAAKTMAFPIEQKGFSLKIDMEKRIPPVKADKDALEQAVLNLLHNAVKYSGESREILLRLHRLDNRARIDIIDQGVGISEDDRSRIFDKFFRVPDSANQKIPGTGLGLTIVSHIAQAHGGKVEVQSRPGAGSTFSLILPLEAE